MTAASEARRSSESHQPPTTSHQPPAQATSSSHQLRGSHGSSAGDLSRRSAISRTPELHPHLGVPRGADGNRADRCLSAVAEDRHRFDSDRHGFLEGGTRRVVLHASALRAESAAHSGDCAVTSLCGARVRRDHGVDLVAPPRPVAVPGAALGAPADYLALTKPRIVSLVVLTVAAGFVVALPAAARVGFDGNAGTAPLAVQLWILAHLLCGTALVAGGTNALNQVAERDVDALMHRTRNRPLPAGRLGANAARPFAGSMAGGGL